MNRGLINATAFAAIDVPLMDPAGRDVVVAIVKASFEIDAQGRAVPAEAPSEVRLDDEVHDPKSPRTSAKYPTELCDAKIGTDVVVLGEAVSRRPVPKMDVAVKVRDTLAPLVVHGERLFYKSMGAVRVGPAAPFERKPIVYEKAYGGMTADLSLADERNPSGVGVAHRPADLDGTSAPQIEHPERPHLTATDDHPPAAFGSILPHWLPRRALAGTFDDAWKKDRMPLLPTDFDRRFYNVAHPALQMDPPIAPGDPVSVLGMTEHGLFSFAVPAFPVIITGLLDRSGKARVRPVIDTMILEPSRRRVELVARAAFLIGRGRDVLREIRVDTHEA